MSVQILTARSTTALSTGTVYSDLKLTNWTATAFQGQQRWMASGVMRNFRVWLTVAPGAGTSRTFTFTVNGSNSAMAVTIADGNTSGQYTATTIALTAGDLVRITQTTSGATAGCQVWVAFEFVPTTNGHCGYGCMSITNEGVGTEINAIFDARDTWIGTATATGVAPSAGNITAVGVTLDVAPGATKSRTYNIFKNGTKQDGTGGTVDTTMSIVDANTANTATFTLPVVAGDRLQIQCVGTNSPSLSRMVWGIRFEPTNPYTSVLNGSSAIGSDPSVSATNYLGAGRTFDTPDATESNHTFLSTLQPFSLTALFICADAAAPGASKSWTVTSRKNSTTPSNPLSAVISGTTTPAVGNDTAHSVSIADGDTFDLMFVPAGTPTTSRFVYGVEITQMVSVPNVVGSAQATAVAALAAVDLGSSVSTSYDPIVAAGNVISQGTAAGTIVAAGTSISIVVSLGPAPPPAGGSDGAEAFKFRFRYGNRR